MEEKQKTLSATGFSGKYLVASLFYPFGDTTVCPQYGMDYC